MSNSEHIPVVIIGAGPAGLTAALLLARQGIDVQVLERHSSTSIHPRARGLNVRTMEIYRNQGLEAAIKQAGATLAASKYMLFVETLAGHEIRRVPDDDLVITGDALAAYTPCSWAQCAQDELEPLLLEATRRSGATISFGTECLGLTQQEDGVQIEARDTTTGALTHLQARYLIAADGANGNIRESVGIPLSEQAVQGNYVNIYFRADLRELVRGREFALCFVEASDAPGIILAVNNTDRWLFNAEYDPTTTSPDAFTPDRCLAVVRAAVGIPDLPIEILSVLPWTAAARCAEQMQTGRVFLMGDAAHTMPPAGGFGLNTGVADAHNLVWKLALVLQGKAAPALLATYETERLPAAQQIVERAVAELTAERPDTPPDEGPMGMLIPVLGFSYTSTAVHPDGTPPQGPLDLKGRPGTRLPHVWLMQQGKQISTTDLLDNRFILLTGPEGDGWQEALQAATEKLHVSVTLYQIGRDALYDPADNWCAANGVAKSGAILVRPDGIIAWRTERIPSDPVGSLPGILAHVLGQSSR